MAGAGLGLLQEVMSNINSSNDASCEGGYGAPMKEGESIIMRGEAEAGEAAQAEFEDSMIVDDDNHEHGIKEDRIVSANLLDVSGDSSTNDALQILQSRAQVRKNLDQLEFQQHTISGSTINNISRRSRPSSVLMTTQQQQQQPVSRPTVVAEKVAHFESESKKNVIASAAVFPSSTFSSDSSKAADDAKPAARSNNNTQQDVHPRFQVILRVRPSTDLESSNTTIQIVSETKVRTHPPLSSYSGVPKEYTFDRVLGPEVSQQHVYQHTAAPLVPRVLEGGSVLLFCYGVTNAGKTYTVHGSSSSTGNHTAAVAPEPSWGIMPRVLHDMYTRVQQQQSDSPKELRISFFEIYQDRFYDLLPDAAPGAPSIPSDPLLRKSLRLREHRDGQVAVRGLAVHTVQSMEQALQWMKIAKKNRVTCTNRLNQTSSRSHFVCQLSVEDVTPMAASASSGDNTAEAAPSSAQRTGGSFWVVDLAGSERSKRTGASGRGMSQKEASTINTSNMVLMHCLMSLQEASSNNSNNNSSHGQPYKVPPYRNSQLTRLLMPHWSTSGTGNHGVNNNTVTAMIVNVNPAASDYDESQHVLGYANQATTIQLPPVHSSSNLDATAPAVAAASRKPAVEYDENGRRVQPGQAAKAAAKDGGMRAKVGKVLRKLSPMRGRTAIGGGAGGGAAGLKRKQADDATTAATVTTTTARVSTSKTSSTHAVSSSSANKRFKSDLKAAPTTSTTHVPVFAATSSSYGPAPTAAARGSAKKPPQVMSVPPTTVNVKSSVAYKKVKAELAVAKTENEILLDKNHELEATIRALQVKMVDMDCEIRSSVMNDLRDEMERQRTQYEAIISNLRQQIPSASVMKQPLAPYLDVNARKIEELEDEVQDYEQQVKELRGDIADFHAQVLTSEAECDRLRKENKKKELALKEYRRLLAEEEPDEDELVQEEDGLSADETDDDDDEEERRDTVLAERRSSVQPWEGFGENRSSMDSNSDNGEEMDDEDEQEEPRRPTLISARPESPGEGAPAAKEPTDSEAHDGPKADAVVEEQQDLPNSGPEKPAAEDAVHIDDVVDAEQPEASATVEVENKHRTFLGFFSPKRGDTSTAKSPKPTSDRKPLGSLGANLCNQSSRSDDEEEEDDNVADLWVEPKVKVKVDPKTGKYKRPKGRMPSGVECWDETKGKWRLSMA